MAQLLVQSLIVACVASFVLSQNLGWNPLTRLYKTRVSSAQVYERPLGSSGSVSGVNGLPTSIPHAGVVVTTTDGGRWLIHKGSGYGRESQTVVTDASNMSNDWTPRGGRKSISRSTVADYVRTGRSNYNLFNDNCLHAASRMIRLN